MKVVLAFLLFAAVTFARPEEKKYSLKFDKIDTDEILNNERLYRKYILCLTSKGSCTHDGKELKEIIPDALKTECAKCNEKQKKEAEKVLKFIIEKKKEDFQMLEKIYDPQGIYRKKYAPEAEKHGIKL